MCRALRLHELLEDVLVEAAAGGVDVRAGVRHAEDLEQVLERSVLAAAAVHCDEHEVRPKLADAAHEVASGSITVTS